MRAVTPPLQAMGFRAVYKALRLGSKEKRSWERRAPGRRGPRRRARADAADPRRRHDAGGRRAGARQLEPRRYGADLELTTTSIPDRLGDHKNKIGQWCCQRMAFHGKNRAKGAPRRPSCDGTLDQAVFSIRDGGTPHVEEFEIPFG